MTVIPSHFYYSFLKAFHFITDIISLGYSELSKSKLSEDIVKSSWPQGDLTKFSDHVKQSVQWIKQKEAEIATSSGNSQPGS